MKDRERLCNTRSRSPGVSRLGLQNGWYAIIFGFSCFEITSCLLLSVLTGKLNNLLLFSGTFVTYVYKTRL